MAHCSKKKKKKTKDKNKKKQKKRAMGTEGITRLGSSIQTLLQGVWCVYIATFRIVKGEPEWSDQKNIIRM